MTDPGALSGLRLLVVEDDMLIAMMIEDILVECGCTVVGPASRLADALRLAQHEAIDGAMLDLNLGGERADGVAAALQARGIPFVVITGYGPEAAGRDLPAVPILPKPFDPETLQQVVAKALGRAE
jgi:CheY-like chemotaxis protein